METERLNLRRFMPDGWDDFSELIRDKMRSPYAACDEQFPTDDVGIKNVLAYFTSTDEFFAVELKAEHKVIGFIALNRIDEETRNLGYCVHSAYQGKGYAGEAVAAVIDYAKHTLKLRKAGRGNGGGQRTLRAAAARRGLCADGPMHGELCGGRERRTDRIRRMLL